MKKLIFIILVTLSLGLITKVSAQQLPTISQFTENKYMWNPALLADGTQMITTAYVKQQWLGFEGAPFYMFAGIQYPFVDLNMSAGAALFADREGPIQKIGLQLMYNYKLREIIGANDQLAFGIQAVISQFSFDLNNESYNDLDDPLLDNGSQSKFYPNIGAGFNYISSTDVYNNNTSFYFGLAFNQVLSTNLLIQSSNFDRKNHFYLNTGAKIYKYDLMFEPFINLNYTNPDILNISVNCNFEMQETFWAGLGFSNTNELSIQAGYILSEIGRNYDQMRIGIMGNLQMGSNLGSTGPGFELFVAYHFEMD